MRNQTFIVAISGETQSVLVMRLRDKPRLWEYAAEWTIRSNHLRFVASSSVVSLKTYREEVGAEEIFAAERGCSVRPFGE
jgi:hypothetical protein